MVGSNDKFGFISQAFICLFIGATCAKWIPLFIFSKIPSKVPSESARWVSFNSWRRLIMYLRDILATRVDQVKNSTFGLELNH